MDWLLAVDSAAPEREARPHAEATVRVQGRSVVLLLATQLAAIALIASPPASEAAGRTVGRVPDAPVEADAGTQPHPAEPAPTAGHGDAPS